MSGLNYPISKSFVRKKTERSELEKILLGSWSGLKKNINSIPFPIIFVCGAPRSGTTVLSQSIITAANSFFIDNTAARYWENPIAGIRYAREKFSKSVFVDTKSTFGRTDKFNIHGFHYFWFRVLHLSFVKDLFVKGGLSCDILSGALAVLSVISAEAGRPIVMKGYYPAYFLDQIASLSKNIFFIHIQRDCYRNCCSILDARSHECSAMSEWWSLPIPDIDDVQLLDPAAQVLAQVQGLNDMIMEKAYSCPKQYLNVRYEDLCENTMKTLNGILAWIGYYSGFQFHEPRCVPAVKPRDYVPAVDDEYLSTLKKLLQEN